MQLNMPYNFCSNCCCCCWHRCSELSLSRAHDTRSSLLAGPATLDPADHDGDEHEDERQSLRGRRTVHVWVKRVVLRHLLQLHSWRHCLRRAGAGATLGIPGVARDISEAAVAFAFASRLPCCTQWVSRHTWDLRLEGAPCRLQQAGA